MHLSGLANRALQALDSNAGAEATEVAAESVLRKSLHQERLELVAGLIKESGARTVADLGCGEGKLLRLLLPHKAIEKLIGSDVSYQELVKAKTRLKVDEMPDRLRAKLELFQSSVLYADKRLLNLEAAALVEVIEHIEPDRLPALAKSVFGFARPATVYLTTPNKEYNAVWQSLPEEKMRHSDHRFEWTRAEFDAWAASVASAFGYDHRILPAGEEDPEFGPPTQLAIFTRLENPVTDN